MKSRTFYSKIDALIPNLMTVDLLFLGLTLSLLQLGNQLIFLPEVGGEVFDPVPVFRETPLQVGLLSVELKIQQKHEKG